MKNILFIPFFLLFYIFGSIALYSQSNTFIENTLSKTEISFGDAAYLVLAGAKIIPEDNSTEEAFSTLINKNWKIKAENSSEPITLGIYSYLLMKGFNIKGGVLYSFFPGPRYAERELDYLGFLKKDMTPYSKVSGEEALRIIGSILNWTEERDE